MMQTSIPKRLSLAPMIDKTVPRFRYFIRKLFPEMQLYTEMISTGAIIYGRQEHLLQVHPCEGGIALQIGSHCAEEAYRAVRLVREASQGHYFTEYNLNVGCPSDRVQNRKIGAILMADPALVAEILGAMRQAILETQGLPAAKLTLKHRLGIVQESRGIDHIGQEQLYVFLQRVVPYCDRLIIHARIAILDGLDPKQNREIPPLNYPLVQQIRRDFSPVPVEINGGLKNLEQISAIWPSVDGVMLGRLSYEDPWELFRIRQGLLARGFLTKNLTSPLSKNLSGGATEVKLRSELLRCYAEYLEENPSGQSIPAQIWPLLGLWYSLPEARRWRRFLSPPYPKELSQMPPRTAVVQLVWQAYEIMGELEQKYSNR